MLHMLPSGPFVELRSFRRISRSLAAAFKVRFSRSLADHTTPYSVHRYVHPRLTFAVAVVLVHNWCETSKIHSYSLSVSYNSYADIVIMLFVDSKCILMSRDDL